MESEPTTRRRALGVLARLPLWMSAASGAVVAGCSSALSRLGRHPGVDAGRVDQLPPGGGRRVSLGGDDSAVVLNVDGTVRAFRAVCTHEGCPLGWNAQQHLIRCPCHGGAYDTNGHVVSGPPPAPLTQLRTVVERGTIYVVR